MGARFASECHYCDTIVDVGTELVFPRIGIPGDHHVIEDVKVKAKVWPMRSGFVFPELRSDDDGVPALQRKPSFAICLSGGGFRATTLALGWIRALHKMGFLAKAQYLCSNSGGSWFNICFSYQNVVSIENFLGDYISPDQLTPEHLASTPAGSYSKVIADAKHAGRAMREIIVDWASWDFWREEDTVHVRGWSEAVGDEFLSQHGLNDHSCAYGLAGKVAEDTQVATGAAKVHTAMRSDDMPYPVVVGCIQARDHGVAHARFYYPFEFSPQYSGVPSNIPDAHPMALGGHLISAYATNSKHGSADSFPAGASGLMEVHVPWVVPLPQVAGISSQAVCQKFGRGNASEDHKFWEFMGGPELTVWNSLNFQWKSERFGDGGGCDNIAIYPPLRRSVRTLLVCLGFKNNPAKWTTDSVREIADKFGRCTSTFKDWMNVEGWNKHQRVFPPEKWEEFLTTAQRLEVEDKPVAFNMRLPVLRNDLQGVEGGYEADVFFIANTMPSAWKNSLPSASQDVLEGKGSFGTRKVVDGFPGISTHILDYEPEMVNLLSQLASWTMLQQEEELSNLIKNSMTA
eukprot:TRINITY_DN12554_c0_g1_i2.p1 TRINITY_DN12554_c0_g1~~TRINITY_DN12554_c0_g1_i2.p1  ORF type:complete len:573 (-),score=96.76 TRINITY_DN12554_c0_g1_i2:75-1793(-)